MTATPKLVMFRMLNLLLAVMLLYLGFRIIVPYATGFSWSEMDWNSNGMTDPIEILASADVGKRNILDEDKACIEYFSLKDASEIKVVCSSQ